jgi:hypothetical protein
LAVLTAVLTHLEPQLVEKQLAYLRAMSPASRFVICHGGERRHFEALEAEEALFIDDSSLRGPHFDKSINETLLALYESYVRDDANVELIYVIEYDHLILSADFEALLTGLAQRSSAGLFAKNAIPRNDTNWPHFLRRRHDERLNRFITGISCRGDVERRWGCLGTGMLLRREALQAFCSIGAPPRYVELLVPTVVYHLGFDVADVDALGDLYASVRWSPSYALEQALACKRAGRAFVHPFKDLGSLETVRAAPSTRTAVLQPAR